MPTSKVQCHGCKRWFQPHRLSQHISKSWEVHCWDALTVSQVPLMSPSIHNAAMQTPLGPTHPPPVSTHGLPNHEYNHARDGQMSGGEAVAFTQGTQWLFYFNPHFWVLDTITDDISGLDNICYDPDPVDVADADTYEELMNSNSRTTNADQATIPILDKAPELTEHKDQTRGDHTDFMPPQAMLTHVIDQFPFGCLGMPMPNKSKGLSMYETWCATSKDTPWTPFCSELDWNVAQWVKMCGPSSTAATELLAIPGVCVSHRLYTMCLIQVWKVVDALGLSFHTVKELNDKIDVIYLATQISNARYLLSTEKT